MRMAVLAAGLLAARAATAGELGVDAGVVRACLASVPAGEVAIGCLGHAADACRARPGGQTTPGIAGCIAAETAAWDDLLNEAYRATRDDLTAQDRADGAPAVPRAPALLAAQRAWLAFRDAECDLSYARWQDGTIRSIVGANCRMVMTAERTVALRDMRGEGR